MKVAVFDVCGTLYDSNTTFDFLDYYLQENKKYLLFRKLSRSLPGKVLNYPFYRFFQYDIVRVIATRYLKGLSEQELQLATKIFVNETLNSKVKKDIQKLLEKYKAEGYLIFLMSGSYSLIVEQVCAYFGADDYMASELEIIDSKYTGRYKTDRLFNKKDLLLEIYPEITKLIVVTDNRTDYELIKVADQGFAVCNKPEQAYFWKSKKLDNVEMLNKIC